MSDAKVAEPAAEEAAQGDPGTRIAAEASGRAPGRANLDFILDVPLRLTVEIGSSQMLVSEVLQLDKGSVVELDRLAGEPADVLVNGRMVARGEITLVDERLAVRLLTMESGTRLDPGQET